MKTVLGVMATGLKCSRLLLGAGILLWLALTQMWVEAVRRYGYRFPRADEENFAEIITGTRSDLWTFLWTNGNEHYSPLTRLYYVVLGWLTNWNIPLTLYVQVGLMSVAALGWFLVHYRREGEARWGTLAVYLVFLSPSAFETWLSACSYAPLFPLLLLFSALYLCGRWSIDGRWLAATLVVGWLCYFMGLLVGGFLISGAVLFTSAGIFYGWRKANSYQRLFAWNGVVFLCALVAAIILRPRPPHHASFLATSVGAMLVSWLELLRFGLLGFQKAPVGLWALGLVGVGIVAWLVSSPPTRKSPVAWPWFYLASGSLVLAGSIAYGRSQYGMQLSRYYLMAAVFWFFFINAFPNRNRFSVVGVAGTVAVLLISAGTSIGTMRSYGREIRHKDNVVVEAIQSYPAEIAVTKVNGSWGDTPDRLLQIIQEMKAAQQGLFR